MNLGRDFGILEDFHPPPGIVHPPLLSPGKQRTRVGLGIRAEATIQKVKVLMKQIKALGIYHAVLPFELDVSVTLKDVSCALWQRQQKGKVPLGFWSKPWNGSETKYTPIEWSL